MSNPKKESPPLMNVRTLDLDLTADEYAAVAMALDDAGKKVITPAGEQYRLLSRLFRLMAIAEIFYEQMDGQAIARAERDLAEMGITNIFRPAGVQVALFDVETDSL